MKVKSFQVSHQLVMKSLSKSRKHMHGTTLTGLFNYLIANTAKKSKIKPVKGILIDECDLQTTINCNVDNLEATREAIINAYHFPKLTNRDLLQILLKTYLNS